jgi:modulator of FtsH protease HflK
MPWNEPGNSSNNQDPWTGRPKQTPPDLEAFLRDLRKKIIALLKPKAFNKKTNFPKALISSQLNTLLIGFALGLLLLAWIFSGFFIVGPAEQAIVTRFGQYHATLSPGRHWIFKPVETRSIISEKNSPFFYQTNVLTHDANKLTLVAKVQYSIVNARQYFFANKPLESLQESIANILQQSIGSLTLPQLLMGDLSILQQTLPGQINSLLTNYATGLSVHTIELETVQIPSPLKASFEDVNRAQTEKEQLENQAKAYAMELEPKSKGEAARIIENAKNYQQKVILNAKAETARFLALLPAYEASPELTRKRLYLAMMQALMKRSHNMIMANPQNSAIYLNVTKTADVGQEKITQALSSEIFSDTPAPAKTSPAKPMQAHHDIPTSYTLAGGYE